jgi:predicted NACHT family NTPase
MGKRSLKASPTGQAKARQAFERTRWTQEQLALEVGLSTRQSVWKFLTGRPIERHIFMDLCFQLDLEWQDIADMPATHRQSPPTAPIGLSDQPDQDDFIQKVDPVSEADTWVKTLRTHLQPHIAQQCGILQASLDLGRPLTLEQLYTPIRIVSQLRQQQWLDLADLQPTPTNQGLGRLAQAHPQAMDAMGIVGQTPQLLLLGKPGAGKTTFLKHIANQCLSGQHRPGCVPIFVTLRHNLGGPLPTAEQSPTMLFSHLKQVCQGTGLTEQQLQGLLHQGRFLMLLDGLDEVAADQTNAVLADIQQFNQRYPSTPCILTSRLTSNPPYLPGFFTTEVDDFSAEQIETFVERWFSANLEHETQALRKTQQFLAALDTAENQPLKELVSTPILLSLLCSVFLARSSFPKQRAKLYQAGLDILLQRWDQARGIQRDQTYQTLSAAERLKLLGQIAATTFEAGQYFFEKTDLLDLIGQYLKDLPTYASGLDLETLHLEGEAILHSIQVQHGLLVEQAKDIYSFSHLTFQEYLTARKVLYQSTPETLTSTIQALATHTLEPRWHEVLRLAANMLATADPLLAAMLSAIQAVIAAEPDCQAFLQTVTAKAAGHGGCYEPAAVRAFYLTLFSDRDLSLATALDKRIAQTLTPDLALDLALARAFEMGQRMVQAPDPKAMLNLGFALQLDHKFELSAEFHQDLQTIQAALPEPDTASKPLNQWRVTQGTVWLDAFQTCLITHRQIAHFHLLTATQRQLIHQYYKLNQVLMDCYRDSQVTPEFRKTLMEEWLRPNDSV